MHLCQPLQTALEGHVPDLPKDIVWGGAKSVCYSFTVSIIVTRGKVEAGLQSAYLSALAAIIYALILAVMKKLINRESYKPFFLSLGVVYLVSENVGPRLTFTTTLFATAFPNMLQKPKMQTPLFGIIVT